MSNGRKNKWYNNLDQFSIKCLIFCLACIALIAYIILSNQKNNDKDILSEEVKEVTNENGEIEFVAKINKIYATDSYIYISDCDGHVFELPLNSKVKNNNKILLSLNEGDYVRFYFSTDYFDSAYIEANSFMIANPDEYYMNKDNSINN